MFDLPALRVWLIASCLLPAILVARAMPARAERHATTPVVADGPGALPAPAADTHAEYASPVPAARRDARHAGDITQATGGTLRASGDTTPGDGWRVVGEWLAVANGDDVRALGRGPDQLWAATAGGGVVRWNAAATTLRQYLGPQDGLPCNTVHDVVQWRGVWWFGTCRGLARYDAARDRMVGVTAPLPSPVVTALAVDDADRLWVATRQAWDRTATFTGKDEPGGWSGGGVTYTADAVAWLTLDTRSGLSSNNVLDLAVWRGNVWAAMEPYLRWQPPGTDAGGDPTVGHWEPYGGGLARRDGEQWTRFDSTTSPELSDNARALAGDAGALWVGTGGRGLVAYDGVKWKALRDCGNPSRCIQDNYVTALAVGGDGAVWVGTARFNGQGTGANVLDARGTPTDDGDDAWTVLGTADGLPGELVHAILPEPDATVWFGTALRDPAGRVHGRGLGRLASDRATITRHATVLLGPGALPDNDVTTIARHPSTGALWVGTARAGIGVRDANGFWTTYTRASTGGGLASDSIADILIEPGGIVWVATRQLTFDGERNRWTDGGLSRFDGRSWTTLTSDSAGLPSNHLSALALDGRGRLWVGTGATDRGPKEHAFRGWGLAVINTQTRQWERTFTFPTLTSDNITDLAVYGNELFVATSYFFYIDPRPRGAQFSTGGGLSVYNLDKGTWRKVTAAEGLAFAVHGRGGRPGDALVDLRSVLVDTAGNAWLGGLSYPEGSYDPEVTPDGVIDVVRPGGVVGHRFPGAGAVVALAPDGEGNVWAASALDGVRVWVQDQWLRQTAAAGGLPSDNLTAISFDDRGAWFGTDGAGLIQLRPAAPGEEASGSVRPIVLRLPIQVFLPRVLNESQPRLVPAP